MSALRISHPGCAPAFIDLGPGAASSGEIRGQIARPLRAAEPWRLGREPLRSLEERHAADVERKRAWRAANRERLRAYEAQRQDRQRAYREARKADPEWCERERLRHIARRARERAMRAALKEVQA